jgi:hypothetical protein
LTAGASALVVVLLAWTRGRRGGRAVWVLALAIFAVSGFHLTGHSGRETWWMALVGHHASLPLVVAILQQEYRFAFADVFLKRALALLGLAGLMLGAWLLADAWVPLADVRLDDPVTFAVLLALWLTAAVAYPPIRRFSGRAVDRYLLSRPDPARQHAAFVRQLAASISEQDVLEVSRDAIASALDARRVILHERPRPIAQDEPVVYVPSRGSRSLASADDAVVVTVATMQAPLPVFVVGDLQHGRRILSDDLDVLDALATAAARRLDALRDERRRLDHAVREQEVGRLATEAELRAVRAQLHPHFLFNALNTVRYLIDAAPDRAGTVLLQLTGVLRAVLRRSSDEFSTLGEEVDLVRSYLAIEQARFESRLQLEIDVPERLHALAVPALLLQPLVENAVVHGISPLRRGGWIRVTATDDVAAAVLRVVVTDSGAGAPVHAFRRPDRVGLASVERRLTLHYGDAAMLHVHSDPGAGTTVCLTLPLQAGTRRLKVRTGGQGEAAVPADRGTRQERDVETGRVERSAETTRAAVEARW